MDPIEHEDLFLVLAHPRNYVNTTSELLMFVYAYFIGRGSSHDEVENWLRTFLVKKMEFEQYASGRILVPLDLTPEQERNMVVPVAWSLREYPFYT